jgi:predicted house-cleaning noncanonical NTP pyrophosphatase (MazG superfamily)
MTEKTIYNKPVRDKLPEIIKGNGDECEYIILSPAEFKKVLLEKYFEEIEEYKNAKTPQEQLDELADIVEITEALAVLNGKTTADLYKIKVEKKEKRGGFEKRIFLISATVKPNSQK